MTNLTSLGNAELMSDLKGIVASERGLTIRFLAYVLEVSQRGLHLDHGFRSLFEFCQSLGLSESSAYKRTAAVGVVKRFPVAWTFIEDGSLHLSHLCQLSSVLTEKNHLVLFNKAMGQSKRAVEKMIEGMKDPQEVKPRCSIKMFKRPATVAPSPVAHSPVDPWTVAPAERSQVATSDSARSSLFDEAEGLLSFEGEGNMPPTTTAPMPPTQTADMPTAQTLPTQTSPLSPLVAMPIAELRLTCSEEFLNLLERAKNLTNTPDAATERLMIRVLGEFVARHAPEEKEMRAAERQEKKDQDLKKIVDGGHAGQRETVTSIPDPTTPSMVPATQNLNPATPIQHSAKPPSAGACVKPRSERFIPAAVKRQVAVEANSRCSFVSPSGRRCSATRFLEIDHVRPIGLGGTSEPSNLRLVCKAHNLQKAKKDFGKEFIESFFAATP